MVHTHGFARYQMDWRISGGTTNGPTEWYQQSEFSKIYHYLTDELGLVLTEIKQD